MWTYGGIRIYPQEFNEETKQIIARLTPLLSNTVHHIFGWEDPIVKLPSYIVGSGNMDTIKAMTRDGVTHALTSTYSIYDTADFYLNSLSIKMLNNVSQCIDLSQPEDAPVYLVDLELFQDV